MTDSSTLHSLGGITRPTVRAPAAVRTLTAGKGWRGQRPPFDPQTLNGGV
jgi:hypothetical protein